MRKSNNIAALFLIASVIIVQGCASYSYSNKTMGEQTSVTPLSYDEPLTLIDVIEANNPASARGLITTDVLIEGANLAIQGVKMMIDKSQEKYTQSYIGGIYNNRFYASNSKMGMLDPNDISFRGFEISRTFELKEGGREMAVFARFVLDEKKLEDIYFNSKFYLKLDTISVEYAKVKVNDSRWYLPWTWFLKKDQHINLDLEIDVKTNWIDGSGVIHSDVPFGKFILPIRKIPLNPNDPTRSEYFSNLSGMSVAGSSYIIPRSQTYCTNEVGDLSPCFGRGDFSVDISVTESSKSDFVSQKLNENSDAIFENIKGEDLINLMKKDN